MLTQPVPVEDGVDSYGASVTELSPLAAWSEVLSLAFGNDAGSAIAQKEAFEGRTVVAFWRRERQKTFRMEQEAWTLQKMEA